MNLNVRTVSSCDKDKELSLETVELLDVDEICGDASDDSW